MQVAMFTTPRTNLKDIFSIMTSVRGVSWANTGLAILRSRRRGNDAVNIRMESPFRLEAVCKWYSFNINSTMWQVASRGGPAELKKKRRGEKPRRFFMGRLF